MTLAVAVAVAYVAARLLWLLLRSTWSHTGLLRPNYRGQAVPTAAGVVVPLAVVLVEAGRVAAGAAGIGARGGPGPARLSVLVTVLGLGLVGMVDDLVEAEDQRRGFLGHVGALARGRLTAGGAKLLGGAGVALVAVGVSPTGGPEDGSSLAMLLADAALVALAANLANLFDRAPGRAIKAGSLSFVVLAVATGGPAVLTGVAVVTGAAAALLVDDLHERLMLGDVGANVLGGAIGLGVVQACSTTTRVVVLAMVAGLNLASEVVSFSRVIDAVAPLRSLDRAGRRHR